MKSESEVQQLVMIEGPNHGCILLRNNSGTMKDDTGRLVRFGLGHTSPKQQFKSSDLIGITTIVITEEMIGMKVGIFTAVEVKKEGWKPSNDKRELQQKTFIDWVMSRGGIAGFASSVDQFKKLLGR